MRDASNVSQRSNTKLCEACAAVPAPDVSGAKPPPRRTKIGEVLAVSVIAESEVLHTVDVTGVLFTYAIDQAIGCSFPGNHTPHRSGLVANARCGVTLRAGHDCAETHVIGWAEVNKTIRRLRLTEERVRAIEDSRAVYTESAARVRGLSPWLKEANELGAAGEILHRIHNLQDEIAAAGDPRQLSEEELNATSSRVVTLLEERDRLAAKLNGFVDQEALHAEDQRRELWDRELAPGVRDLFKQAQKGRF